MAGVNPVQVQKHLKGVDYPATREDLIEHARNQGADEEIIKTLEELPDERYQTPADVTEAMGDII